MDDKKENHSNPKRMPKRNRPQQLQTHNMSTDDVEYTHCTLQGGDLQFANKQQTISRGTESMLQGKLGYKSATIHWSTHSQREKNETEKSMA